MSNKTIIVLDDDELLRKHFSLVLETIGYAVIGASNSEHILDLIDKHAPALVITDLYMPDHNGTKAIIEITNHSKIPIIAISAYENMIEIMKLMTTASLLKPITDEQLISTVIEILGEQ
ncbi:MAG: response regulator [Gammaproteobacteria bacterium]|nr:response regulator [Gammaproteobacteria bacterium]